MLAAARTKVEAMKHMQLITATILFWSSVTASSTTAEAIKTSRIVTLSGTITEIVFALGASDQVVGVDASSSYPQAVNEMPKVSYHRRLSAEGVLSLVPTLVIATSEAGPPAAIEHLRSAGVELLILPHEPTVESALAKIELIATTLGASKTGETLIARIRAQLALARSSHPTQTAKIKVLFIYARGQGTLNVAGRATGADTIIELAGGVNAVQGYEGYKPLTSEAVIAAAPDVILLLDKGLESIGGSPALWELPGLVLTPAGRQRRVISLDGLLLLGFGPRLGQAAMTLQRDLYPTPASDERQ